MAKKNRVDLNAVIQANLPDNNTDFITPALDREVEIDEVDSCFNLEDDTAVDVNYAPTTPADWGGTLPTEVGDGLDILIKKVSANYSNNLFYVSKKGSDEIGEFEVGNEAKPFLTIQAALDAMPSSSILKVLGGGTYSESIVINGTNRNCIYDFGNCQINNITADFTFQEDNNNIIENLRINNTTGASTTNRATWNKNIIITSIQSIFFYGKFNQNCTFTSSNNSVTLGSGTNFVSYFDTCVILNTASGNCIASTVRSIFNNCLIQSTSGSSILTRSNAPLINQTIRIYNSTIKSNVACLSGANGVTDLMAYNTKFYSTAGNVIEAGGVDLGGKILLFDACEFYAKGSNDVLNLASIERTITDNYTFKDCVFDTETGFPISEGTYTVSDAGTTLLINCIYNALTVTSVAPVKVTEHNSFQFTNYTDFNVLQ